MLPCWMCSKTEERELRSIFKNKKASGIFTLEAKGGVELSDLLRRLEIAHSISWDEGPPNTSSLNLLATTHTDTERHDRNSIRCEEKPDVHETWPRGRAVCIIQKSKQAGNTCPPVISLYGFIRMSYPLLSSCGAGANKLHSRHLHPDSIHRRLDMRRDIAQLEGAGTQYTGCVSCR